MPVWATGESRKRRIGVAILGILAAGGALLLRTPGGGGGSGADCGTEIFGDIYSNLCHEDYGSLSGWTANSFTAPTQPTTTGSTSCTTMACVQTACQADGSAITITADITTTGTSLLDCADTEIIINDAVSVTELRLTGTPTRVWVHGAGPTSKLGFLRISTGVDVILDSVLMPNGLTTGPRIQIATSCTRCVFAHVVAEGDASSTSDVFQGNATDIAIVNSNFLSPFDNGGLNDWCIRLSTGARWIMADVMFQNSSSQQVVRGQDAYDDILMLRGTFVNLNYCNWFGQTGTGPWTDFHAVSSHVYMNNLSNEGDSFSAAQSYATLDSINWHTEGDPDLCTIDSGDLTGQHATGTPTYAYDNTQPAWPVITSHRGYDMDADADGVDDGNPGEL